MVEANHVLAGLHERCRNRYAVAATDVENARASGERGRDRERFSNADGPAAIGPVPVGNQIVLAHARRVRLYNGRTSGER
jgi:hypothetical protein